MKPESDLSPKKSGPTQLYCKSAHGRIVALKMVHYPLLLHSFLLPSLDDLPQFFLFLFGDSSHLPQQLLEQV
jgi:hypothetical protein